MAGLDLHALEAQRQPRKKYADAKSLASADSLALPIDQDDVFDEPVILGQGKASAETKRRILSRKVLLSLSSILTVAIVSLVVVLMMTMNDRTESSVDKVVVGSHNIFAAGPELNDIYSLLKSKVHDPNVLLDMETPEGRAFKILVDERKVDTSTALRSDFYVQRYALLVLFFGTNGGEWTYTSGWSSQTESFEEWYGVVSQDSMVIGIDLDGNNLSGKISEDFCLMNDLEFLRLNGNSVELPACLPQLSKLHELDYRNNNFSGVLPSGLSAIHSLKSLLLSDNDFVGSIDALFSDALGSEMYFPKLKILNLANNDLSGEIPESILRRLPSLDVLLMHGNPQISGSLDEMCKGDMLSEIDVDCDQVSCRCCTLGQNCPSSPLAL